MKFFKNLFTVAAVLSISACNTNPFDPELSIPVNQVHPSNIYIGSIKQLSGYSVECGNKYKLYIEKNKPEAQSVAELINKRIANIKTAEMTANQIVVLDALLHKIKFMPVQMSGTGFWDLDISLVNRKTGYTSRSDVHFIFKSKQSSFLATTCPQVLEEFPLALDELVENIITSEDFTSLIKQDPI